ncbi:ComEC/Rec2 family competence protein [Pimelobacter simplex]|uniref:ComEC/Rec2 family competence protein n=1 Tax=Nocardioides simplex TaxID=2045 RepID=UPI0021504F30|nr:ComEC/Rec2 family competence protein [Pimelobacter simplex]UUW89156.1 ComEC/Rec2 family competence protein [Pimelobacter simplex]UUW98660.1 ComEC/Rec2 family competence protein [Pimelobacter simplex]
MPLLGAAVWLGAIAATRLGGVAYLLVLAVAVLLGRRARVASAGQCRLFAVVVLLGTTAVTVTLLRHDAVRGSPVHALAEQRATAEVVATVISDPRVVATRAGPRAVVRLRVGEVSSRRHRLEVGGTVVLIGDPVWTDVALGERVRTVGRLAPADDPDTLALLTDVGTPYRLARASPWWRASGALRASIRDAVAHRPPEQAGLVPALVDGDDAGLPADLQEDFRTTGLTHLTAVSGTNLTLVVGALLLVARAVRVRSRWLVVVGLLGIAGFVLLARTEPSVLRAAVMGGVALFAFGPDGRRRGLRALGVAVAALVLVQPGLALAPGFALSVLATGGIVLLGLPLAAALGRWLPRALAEAVAVPTAAQLACTPVIAVLSGQVSLVAVVANLLAGPLVAPATVLGLVGGLVGLVWPAGGRLAGTAAAWCVAGLVEIAERGAALPGAAVGWGSGPVAIGLLVVLCLLLAVALPVLVRRPVLGVGLAVLLLLVVLGVPGRFWSRTGPWPPPDWVLVACDVGQGDALVLNAGPRAAIVVDAGPEPDAVDDCLDRLDVEQVPLVLLTHFHADHIDGLPGVLHDRRVGAIETTSVRDPPAGAELVDRTARDAGVPVTTAPFGSTRRIGAATLQVLHPAAPAAAPTRRSSPAGPAGSASDDTDGSAANDASVVLLVEVAGVRILLTGDLEPTGQAELAQRLRGGVDLDIDVLKVPHHGSSHQDRDWLTSLHPEVALISVGADNGYGHPAPAVVQALQQAGAEVRRTDRAGDLAVLAPDSGVPGGRVTVATRR